MTEAEQIARYPTRRCQEVVEFDDGSRVRRCYSHNCPHYYQDETGQLRPIDLAIREKQNAKVGKHHVRDRHVVSVGHRDDGERAKFLAFRPDVNQALGTEQLEFSLDSIEFDGVNQTADLSKNDKVDDLTTKLGSILVRSTRQRTRQLVRVERPISSFEIRYTLHVEGLRVEEKFGEYHFFGKDGEFRFRIRKPCLCGLDFQPLDIKETLVEHSLTDNHDGTFAYAKTSTTAFATAELPAVYHVDADVYYSDTADGSVVYFNSSADWDTLHDAATGTGVNDTNGYGHPGVTTTWAMDISRIIQRSFFNFDTSGTISPVAVSLRIHAGESVAAADVCAQKGTQASLLTTADYDSFAGSSYGGVTWVRGIWNTIAFDAMGIDDLNTDGITKICCREQNYDYSDIPVPDFSSLDAGMYYADQAGTDKDPYLEITEGGGGATLVIQDSECIVSSESPTFARHTLLVIADSECLIESDDVSLTQHQALAVADSVCLAESDAPALTQHQCLNAQDNACTVESESPALAQHQVLSVADSVCQAESETVVLVQSQALTVADSQSVVASNSPALTQHQALAVPDSRSVVESDSPALTQHQVLSVGDSWCVVTCDSPTLSVSGDGGNSILFLLQQQPYLLAT